MTGLTSIAIQRARTVRHTYLLEGPAATRKLLTPYELQALRLAVDTPAGVLARLESFGLLRMCKGDYVLTSSGRAVLNAGAK